MELETATQIVSSILKQGNRVSVRAMGTSMVPYLWPEDHLVVRPLADGESLAEGQVIVYQGTHNLIAHRLVTNDKGSLTSRGDSCLKPDSNFDPSKVLGIVIAREQNGAIKYFNPRLSHLWIRYLLAAAPLSYRINNLIARASQKIKKTFHA